MSNVIILKYKYDEYEFKKLEDTFHYLQKCFPEDIVIAIPSSSELLLDCDKETLYNARNLIDKAIKEKENN